MEILSLIGIVVGIGVFILCCTKGVNLVVSGFLGALIIIVTSGNPILEGIISTWASGFSGFIKSYFLVFVLSALFGKTLGASGAAKRIAIAVYHLCGKSKRNAKFLAALFVPTMYAILSYVGVSGFVIVYAVMDIALYVFQKNDLPWRMYCYGGATVLATIVCVSLGILACFVVMPGRIKNINEVVTSGITSGFMPILGVAAASAVGTCLKTTLGFTLITEALYQIPSLYGGCIMIAVLTFCTASSTGGVNAIGPDAFALFTQAGLSPATAHRLMTSAIFAGIPPHSSGPVNAMSVAKIRYGAGIWCYIRTNFIGGGLRFLIVLLLVKLGVFL